jgi:predicted Rossmann-fold nucleotide-binding protein
MPLQVSPARLAQLEEYSRRQQRESADVLDEALADYLSVDHLSTGASPFTRRRIGVCGASRSLPSVAVALCRCLGARLAREETIAIVSGGTKRRRTAIGADNFATEWLVVSAAQAAIQPEHVDERIVTVVQDDHGGGSRFQVGRALRARGNTSEARRISFVRKLDALIAICGGAGTRQELALAIEFGIKVLPVPGFSGAAPDVWSAYRAELISALHIDESRASSWEDALRSPSPDCSRLADDMIDALMASLPKRCFVIMPFHDDFADLYDEFIHPEIVRLGDLPVRVDRIGVPGNVTAQIEDGLRSCDYAVAVLDRLRPNVLYELGLAHAFRKPVVLLNREGALGGETVPFDIHTQQRLEYKELDPDVRTRLSRMAQSARSPLR